MVRKSCQRTNRDSILSLFLTWFPQILSVCTICAASTRYLTQVPQTDLTNHLIGSLEGQREWKCLADGVGKEAEPTPHPPPPTPAKKRMVPADCTHSVPVSPGMEQDQSASTGMEQDQSVSPDMEWDQSASPGMERDQSVSPGMEQDQSVSPGMEQDQGPISEPGHGTVPISEP